MTKEELSQIETLDLMERIDLLFDQHKKTKAKKEKKLLAKEINLMMEIVECRIKRKVYKRL